MIQNYIYRDADRTEHKVFIRDRNLEQKRERIQENPSEVTLCAECAWKFYESPWHSIHRKDPYQLDFKICRVCNAQKGYIYEVEDQRKKRINKDNIIVVPQGGRT